MSNDVGVLRSELEAFSAHKTELLGSAEGKWVLIRGNEIVTTFDCQPDAVAEGYRKFGNVSFLVKQVVRFD